MRNKTQARDRRRGEVEVSVTTQATQAMLKQVIELCQWLDMFFNRIESDLVSSEMWRRAGINLEELRQRVGNGPDVQTATAEWLRAGLAVTARLLADPPMLELSELSVRWFIGNATPVAPINLATYESHLFQAQTSCHVTPQALEELRLSYWALLVTLMRRANETEAAELGSRLHRQITAVYSDSEQSYRRACQDVGIDPGPSWPKPQPARELAYV